MREASFYEVLKSHFSNELATVWTCLPCTILTVHNNLSDQKIDVKPLINKVDSDGNSKEHPPILFVPVVFPASKTSAFTFPLSVGDTVLCVFSQRGLDVFKGGNGLSQAPYDLRKMDKRDAIAIPGLFPFGSAINSPKKRTNAHSTNDAVIVHNIGKASEVELRLKLNGDLIINSPAKVIVNATDDVEVNTDSSAVVNAAVSADVVSPITTVQASTSFAMTSPTMTFNGNMIVNGNFTMTSAGSYTASFNGDVEFAGGTVTHEGVDISSTHTHDVPSIQSGSTTRTSTVPN